MTNTNSSSNAEPKIGSPITILKAVQNIDTSHYLLPAIQRKFVWSTDQICVLFDSILRGYPINIFMSWSVSDSKIKAGQKFYSFLRNYCERFDEDNPMLATSANTPDFEAIIDGQQRLTSIYIGLKGTYSQKKPRIWWPSAKNDSDFPPKRLCLNIVDYYKNTDDKNADENNMRYEFVFLSSEEKITKEQEGKHFFVVGDILNFSEKNEIEGYLEKHGLSQNINAREILSRLYEEIIEDEQLYFSNITSNDLELVLDIFIRTNSGGTKLSFADLLMSIAISHWKGDFRKEIDDFSLSLLQNSNTRNYVERDWLLKACLMLVDEEIRFQVKNFDERIVEEIQNKWSEIKACVTATFTLLSDYGFNEESRALTAKNAAIPIAYYLFKKQRNGKPLYLSINTTNPSEDIKRNRELVIQWLCMALLRGAFGGQGDTVLSKMRDVIEKSVDDDGDDFFPLEKIKQKFKNTNKSIEFSDDVVEELLKTRKDHRSCRPLLHLLFPEVRATETLEIDHMHPSSRFKKLSKEALTDLSVPEEQHEYFLNSEHWDSLPNLTLLPKSNNASKNDGQLSDWIEDKSGNSSIWFKPQLLLKAEEFDFGFENFPDFFNQRKSKLKELLKERVGVVAEDGVS